MEFSRDETGRVMTLSGELSIEFAQGLREALQDHLGTEGAPTVDLTGVTGCDAAVLQLLISASKTASATDRRLDFVGVPDEIFEMSKGLGLMLFDTTPTGGPRDTA